MTTDELAEKLSGFGNSFQTMDNMSDYEIDTLISRLESLLVAT